MSKKSLFQQNPHLRNAQDYQCALRASVLSSIAIEGVKKAAERALLPAADKLPLRLGGSECAGEHGTFTAQSQKEKGLA